MAVPTPPCVIEAFGRPRSADQPEHWYELDLSASELWEIASRISAGKRSLN